MISILFVCKDNQVHSQIAECICKFLGNRICQCDSAGVVKGAMQTEVVELLNDCYGIDILETQSTKEIADLKNRYDIVIGLNLEVDIEAGYFEKWQLPNTLNENLVATIEMKVMQLLHEIKIGDIR